MPHSGGPPSQERTWRPVVAQGRAMHGERGTFVGNEFPWMVDFLSACHDAYTISVAVFAVDSRCERCLSECVVPTKIGI